MSIGVPTGNPAPAATFVATPDLLARYAASAIESKAETYANVARITLDALSAYADDVRAARQIKGGIAVKPGA